MKTLSINRHKIGSGHPVYIIAEMSANHHHDYEQAVRILEAARAAGANAIKLQTYTPETITLDCDGEAFQLTDTLYEGRTLYDLYKETYTPWEWHSQLKRIAVDIGLDFFSTPFDFSAVDFLESLDVPAYKLASSELVDLPLIERIARTGKPILMSTGMATVGEIESAVQCAKTHGCDDILLLKCTAAYPAPPETMNLKCIPALEELFGLPIGLSDHSLGIEAAVAAVSLGARAIEKHITLARTSAGADDAFSLEPDEFAQMVKSVRIAESMQGSVTFGPVGNEIVSKKYRRSIYVTVPIRSGELITYKNTRSIRPGGGISPGDWQYAIGKKARRDLETGTPLTWDCIE